jgi:hypothetical protein
MLRRLLPVEQGNTGWQAQGLVPGVSRAGEYGCNAGPADTLCMQAHINAE